MKLCVPTMGERGLDEQVSPHFGRAPTFVLYDTETGTVEILPNRSEHMGGFGKPPEKLAEAGAEVMLCSALGPRAIRVFEQLGIEVYVGATGTVSQAIEMWRSGKLQMATDENACKMHKH